MYNKGRVMNLNQQQCEACKVGAPQLSKKELAVFLNEYPSWSLIEEGGINKILREYTFKDFSAALSFTNAIGVISEQHNHHPDILTQWGKVTVTWWTHKINGLHKNDIIMASRSEALFNQD
jgi:4a-hydroxytetrahydrobiopterin dehydratase